MCIPEWRRHETRELVLTLTYEGVPQNLDDDPDMDIEFQVKAEPGDADPALVSLTLGSGITKRTQTGADVGKVDIVIPYTAWSAVPAGYYYYEVAVIFTGSPAVRKYPVPATYFQLVDVVNAP